MPALKKLFISTLLGLMLLSSFSSPILAQSSTQPKSKWYNQNFSDWFVKVYDSPDSDVFGERYTAAQVQWIIYGLGSTALTGAAGVVGMEPKTISCMFKGGAGLTKNIINAPIVKDATPAPIKIGAVMASCGVDQLIKKMTGTADAKTSPKGLAQQIFLEDRPLSGISYFRNAAMNWHIIPEVKAQQTPGFGFSALNPVLPLWRASRNVAYGVLVFAILIMSFMIMFRVKINPQTVITVQSALPKIVAALILITFSYAIAGLMVDFMYVVIGFISIIFSTAWQGMGINFATSPANFFGYMTTGPLGLGIFGAIVLFLWPVVLVTILLLIFGGALMFTGAGSIAGIVFLILGLVLLITVFIFYIRAVWVLLRAFAFVILLTAFAPLQIALGIVVPAVGFGQWVRSFISNLVVFPVVGVFFALAYFFIFAAMQAVVQSGLSGTIIGTPGWPPLLSSGLMGAGGITVMLLYFALSLVIFALIPRTTEIIQGIISGRPFAYGTAVGEAAGPITAPLSFVWKAGTGIVSKGISGVIGQRLGIHP